MFNQVLEFHEKFNHPINVEPTPRLLDLRFNLHHEEMIEVAEELAVMSSMAMDDEADGYDIRNNKIALTKELCDVLYVIIGTAVSLGLPLEEAFNEVHRSNMSKLGADGKPILREDGKVLKGSNYSPANLEQFFV